MASSGPLAAKSVFGPNYERLVQLKKRYDPANFFHLNQNIDPVESTAACVSGAYYRLVRRCCICGNFLPLPALAADITETRLTGSYSIRASTNLPTSRPLLLEPPVQPARTSFSPGRCCQPRRCGTVPDFPPAARSHRRFRWMSSVRRHGRRTSTRSSSRSTSPPAFHDCTPTPRRISPEPSCKTTSLGTANPSSQSAPPAS